MPARFRLAELLEEKGMTQSDLARLSGVSLVTINRMCLNRTRGVSLETLDALARPLGVSPGTLIGEEPEAETRKPKRKA